MAMLTIFKLTKEEKDVIETLIQLTRFTYDLLDNSEDRGGTTINVERDDFDEVSSYLDVIDSLPDDQPGVTMGPAAKVEWALRRILV